MMERAVVLVLCWTLMLGLCTPLYPSLRFGQRATAILMSSSLEDPLQPPTDYRSARSQHVEFRSGRHADAIFTNSYRKVLGQISARKFLQTVTGKGSRSRPESEPYVKRQAGIFEDTYKQDLMSFERERSYRKQQRGRRGFSLQCSGCDCGVLMNRKCPENRHRK
ncbi:somatoliberin isoform X1 [Tachysurus fulvidraco]|uniref:somatoliberin isoform X1 n=1 Tax=Tachysurus fulvidraco TaxID=1234273 RepID=UPI000F4DFA5D|nr:somatoliberin isoform X1 [Tachysurus fulvidraco]